MIKRKVTDFWFWVKILVALFLLVFLVYPFFTLISRSFFSAKTGNFSLENYKVFLDKKYYYSTLGRSLNVSVIATITTMIIGLPMAYLMSRYNIIGKNIIHIMIIMSLMSPPFIGAYSWILLFGRAGFVTKIFALIGITTPTIYGKLGIITVFTFKLYPYVYLYTSGAMGSIDSSLEEASEGLGSSPLRRLLTVTIPVVLPSIAAGALMVFMTSLADFGTPMLIGEGYTVLPVMVYNEYLSEIGGNANFASTLSVIIVLFSMTALMIQKLYIEKRNYSMTAMRPPAIIKLKGIKRFLVSLPVFIAVFIGFLPQIVVVVTSFLNSDFTGFTGGFGLGNYQIIAKRLKTNIINTFSFSTIAIIIIIIIAMLMSYIIVRQKGFVGRAMDFLIMFPYVIPGAVLGISFIVAFNKKPLILTGTAAILIISMVIRKMPYTVRSGSAILLQIDPSVEEASVNLGVSPQKTFFTITARLMAPGILSGGILSWITAINELSSSIMLYSGKTSTIPVAIYTEVARNSHGTAAALATILTFTTAAALLIFLKVSDGKVSVV